MNHTATPGHGGLPKPGPLLLVNFLNYGHFPAYAANLARWAFSRGLEVVHLGLTQPGEAFSRTFAGQNGLTLLHPAELGLDAFGAAATDTPDKALKTFGRHWKALLAGAFARHPDAQAVLLNADHLFFESDECCAPNLTLPGPVWAVATFAHREAHTGLDEPYARRMNALLRERQGFRGVLSIDEQHVRTRDPEETFLRLLPDPYREFQPLAEADLTPGERADLDALHLFLGQDERPVLPVIGKFDRRKNNLWILRAAEADPGLRVVVLGQRVPDAQTDAQIDAALERLASQGRVFARFGYVPQALFHAALASPRAACLPLAYRNHFGSSGIQLMGAEYGLPVLVPETGLMAERVARHGLGRLFTVGSPASFAEQLGLLAREGRQPYAEACARFIAGFGAEALGVALDRALLGQDHPASPLLGPDAGEDDPWAGTLAEDNPEPALARLESPEPAGPPRRVSPAALALRRAVLRWRANRQAAAAEDLQRCLAAGLLDELRFLSSLVMDIARDDAARGAVEPPLNRTEAWLAALYNLQEPDRQAGRADFVRLLAGQEQAGLLAADFWERLGGLYVRAKELRAGEECFRQAMRLDPDDPELYLTLSDVLRYQGRDEESLAVLDALEARAPEHHGLHHKRGQVLLQMGQRQAARTLFLREPQTSRHWDAAREHLARLDGTETAG